MKNCSTCGAAGASAYCAHCGAAQAKADDMAVLNSVTDDGENHSARPDGGFYLAVDRPLNRSSRGPAESSMVGLPLTSASRSTLPRVLGVTGAFAAVAVTVLLVGLIGRGDAKGPLINSPGGSGSLKSQPTATSGADQPAAAGPRQLTGSMTVVGVHGGAQSNVTVVGGTCTTARGFSDVAEGASVTVYDKTGTIVATGALGRGSGTMRDQSAQFPDIYIGICTFPFSIQVPDSDFYQVEVTHRGRTTVARADMSGVRLSLGS